MTLEDWLVLHPITIESTLLDPKTVPYDPEFKDMDHWMVKLSFVEAETVMQITFHTGIGLREFDRKGYALFLGRNFMITPKGHQERELDIHKAQILRYKDRYQWANDAQKKWWKPVQPKIEDVLRSLILDAGSYEDSADFEDWASNFGYDTDSRQAERIYNQVVEQSRCFRAFLSPTFYSQLLYEVEVDD